MLDNLHVVKIAVHAAEGCFTATTMAYTSIKQQISDSAWLRIQQSILLNFHPQPSVAHLEVTLPDVRIQDTNVRDKQSLELQLLIGKLDDDDRSLHSLWLGDDNTVNAVELSGTSFAY